MFGGGEEYFQDPPAIDADTLHRFAVFCAQLRRLERPSRKAIDACAAAARDVGTATSQACELVVGTLLRHVKTWTGTKQLACWYVLDKLCKENRDTYAYTAGKYILDVGRDYIPYEDDALGSKYEALVEHWQSVFPRHVVDALWLAKKERLWATAHADEVAAQQRAEEQAWAREERELDDVDGLNDYGQPCMDYLQGRCTWGDQCRLYHPPGEEGSLPLECRLGDWKCASCGVINRHYRRRCSNCVREKPQYKRQRGSGASAEDALLSSPDAAVMRALRQQFGFDPCNTAEAVAHWRARLSHMTLSDYLDERRAAYRVRILGQPARTTLEQHCKAQKHFADVQLSSSNRDDDDDGDADGTTGDHDAGGRGGRKRARREWLVPVGADAAEAVAAVAQTLVERGVRDALAPRLYDELAQHVQSLAVSTTTSAGAGAAAGLSRAQAEVLLSAAKLAFTAWNTNRDAAAYAAGFFAVLRRHERLLGLDDTQREQLTAMTQAFLA